MRVLHVINSLNIGGAEKLLTMLIPGLISNGFEVDLLVFGNNNENSFLETALLKEKVKIIHSDYGIYDLRNIFFIYKFISDYDIIHSHLFPAQYWVAFSKVLSKSKTVFITTEHSTSNRRRKYFVFKWIDSYVFNRYNRIISISESTRLSLLNWLIFKNSNKCIVINNGIELDEFAEAEAYNRKDISNTSDEKKIVLMIARFSEEKDHSTLISAIPLLTNNVEVWLVGGGDKRLIAKCNILVKRLRIEDSVKFFEKRNDIPKIIKTVDLCILSSKWEGFGLVVVEYMAAGKPVIASDVEGLKQIVEGAGLLFKQGNYYDLAEKIDLVLNEAKLYNDMIFKGYERSRLFSLEKMVQAYTEVYRIDVLK